MGVDVRIYLPDGVRIGEVAVVAGIAAGLKPTKAKFSDGWYVEVLGATASPAHIVGMAEIVIVGDLVDGEKEHRIFYHYEPYGGGRLLMARSTAFWIVVGKKLVAFFGGCVDFNDCDDEDRNYQVDPKYPDGLPVDGKDWKKFQERMLAVKAITQKELEAADKVAAYKMAETRGR